MNAPTTPFSLREMTGADLKAASGLSTLAGWNQTMADWQRLLSLEPHGCFVACIGDEVRGTVTTTSYRKRFGWIGMVLVHPEVRRCGMGSALLQRGINYLDSIGVETVRLDATPLGQPVYERAGFVVEYDLARYEGTVPDGTGFGGSNAIVPIEVDALPSIAAFDAQIFGADRSALLRALHESNPHGSAVCYRDGAIQGYALGRQGIRANYLGPWIASDVAVARQLAGSILHNWAGETVFVDVNLSNAAPLEAVNELRLRPQRQLIRMYKGPNTHPGRPDWLCGIAGPEVG
jgi:GNAT superfamily N-acetyltransferase